MDDPNIRIVCKGAEIPVVQEAGLGEVFRVNRRFTYTVELVDKQRIFSPSKRPPGRITK